MIFLRGVILWCFSISVLGLTAQGLLFDECGIECHKALHNFSFKQEETVADINVLHHTCRWNIDPAQSYISGSVQTTFTANAPASEVVFDLHDSLTVDSILRGAFTLSFSHVNHQIRIPFNVSTGQVETLTIYYHGTPGNSGFGSFVQTEHESQPIVWTLSEPYGARDWWPCRQNLSDKIDSIDIYITTPLGFTGVSNGVLADTSANDSTVTYHWQHRYPIATYLVALSATNYIHYIDTVVLNDYTIPVHNFVFPESEAEARTATAKLADQMQLFDSLFGHYPFKEEKYGHAQFGWGGGMEHQTITFMGGWGWELMAHELAHHWFGNAITCGSWQDIWLNEGFATYLSGLCYEFIDTQWWMPFKNDRMNRATQQTDGSVYCTDTTEVSRIFSGRITYAKGAMILHTLRWLIGDSAFFSALKNYMSNPNLRFGFATSNNLITAFEQASGSSLHHYFQQWLYSEGYPTYEVLWSRKSNTEILVSVHQTTSHPSVDFFDLPIPVRCFGEGLDTTFRLNHIYSGQVFTLNVPFKTDSVAFDPDRWILSRSNTVHKILSHKVANDILIDIMPVPVKDELTVKVFCLNAEDEVTISALDINGRVLYQNKMTSPAHTIPTSDWAAGVYQIVFRTASGLTTRSVIKTNQ